MDSNNRINKYSIYSLVCFLLAVILNLLKGDLFGVPMGYAPREYTFGIYVLLPLLIVSMILGVAALSQIFRLHWNKYNVISFLLILPGVIAGASYVVVMLFAI